MVLEDREEENPFPHVDHGVQQHQKGSKHQSRLMCGNCRDKVGGAGHGSHQGGAYSVKEKSEEKQRADQARIRHAGSESIVLNSPVSVAIGATGAWHGHACDTRNGG